MRNSVGSSGPPSPATAHCYFSHRNLHQGRRCGKNYTPSIFMAGSFKVHSTVTGIQWPWFDSGTRQGKEVLLFPFTPPPSPLCVCVCVVVVVLLLFLFCSSESTTCADSLSLFVSQSVCTAGTEVVVHVKDPMCAYYKRKPLYWWHGIHR